MLADWLLAQKQVVSVYYPGLFTHLGYGIMKEQARGFGAMISFTVGSKELAFGIVENISLIQYAESLGGTETLITYPLTRTHAEVSEELRKKNGITDCLLRLSVGIENVEDLILDLENAIHKAEAGILKSRQIIYRSHCDLV